MPPNIVCARRNDFNPNYSINHAVQIFPLASDFYPSFVHTPPTPRNALMSAKYLIQTQRRSVERSTTIPRSAIISSWLRKLSE